MPIYKVFLDASTNVIYSSYYIKGVYNVFGKENVKFSSKYFKNLARREDDWSYDSYMPVIITKDEKEYKFIIDFGDDVPIRKNAYQWCDVYAKINYCPEKTGNFEKVISIAPSFGIRIWNFWQIIFFSISNLFKLNFKPQISLYKYFHSYFSQLKLLKIEKFTKKENVQEKGNYIFSIASLWPHQNCLEGTNLLRKTFMESCKNSNVEFEGGFLLSEDSHPQKNEFEHLIFNKRYPLKEFIKKTKKSAIVFNTPAVHNCHGWELGQYLAMGKAVISTPLQNKLPLNFVHGENIHFVNDEIELKKAIDIILNNEEYRIKLEKGASKYYETFASPTSSIKTIVEKLEIL